MDQTSSRQCRVVIEHHQLIGFEDVEFSPAFNRACSQDLDTFCSEIRQKKNQDKAELLECLAEALTESAFGQDFFESNALHSDDNDKPKEVSPQCRKHIQREFLQQRANPLLDPLINNDCREDIVNFKCKGPLRAAPISTQLYSYEHIQYNTTQYSPVTRMITQSQPRALLAFTSKRRQKVSNSLYCNVL